MSPNSRSFDEQTTNRLLIGLVVLGVVLIVAMVPSSPFRNATLGILVPLFLPVVIAALVYLRERPSTSSVTLLALIAWGTIAAFIAAFVSFFLLLDNPVSYPGAVRELIGSLLVFAAGLVALGGTYALAARRDRYRLTVLALAPIAEFVALSVALAASSTL